MINGFVTQSNSSDAWVGVDSSGTSNATGTPVALEFLIQGKDPPGRIHIGFEEYSNQGFGPQG